MNTITVRRATLSDLPELAVLFDEYRVFQGKQSDLLAAGDFLRARFIDGDSAVFIACESSVPLGFAQLYPSYSSVALARIFILNDLFVRETGRRKGVASQLLDAIESHAWSCGAVRVTLNVDKANAQGQALYAARGWKQDQQFFMYHRYPGDQ